MKRMIAILLCALMLSFVPAAQAEAKTYKSCTDLRKAYKYGVSNSKNAVNRGAGPIFSPRVSVAIYRLNVRLDTDRDGIACEVVRPKPKPNVQSPQPVEPTPLPTQTPTPTPTPTPAPSPSATAAPQNPNPESTLPTLRTLAGLNAHMQQIELKARSQPDFKFNYTSSPRANPRAIQEVVGAFVQKIKIFQLVGLEKINMNWVLSAEIDHAWWRQTRLNQLSSYPVSLWDNSKNVLGHCNLSSDVFCGAGTSIGGTLYQDNVVGTAFSGRGLQTVSRHEAAHFYQQEAGFGDVCWFAEGQATFVEVQLDAMDRRSWFIDRLKANPTGVGMLTASQIQTALNRNTICDGSSYIRYDLGMLVFEYLMLNYTMSDIHKAQLYMKQFDWQAAVQNVLKTDITDLNAQIAGYVHREINRLPQPNPLPIPKAAVPGATPPIIDNGNPVITGSPVVGQLLTATFTPQPGIVTRYQWFNSDGFIPGATSLTYRVRQEDVGKLVWIGAIPFRDDRQLPIRESLKLGPVRTG